MAMPYNISICERQEPPGPKSPGNPTSKKNSLSLVSDSDGLTVCSWSTPMLGSVVSSRPLIPDSSSGDLRSKKEHRKHKKGTAVEKQ